MGKIIKVRIAKKYKHDLAEKIIKILSDIHNIGTEYVQTDTDKIILNIYPYDDRTLDSLEEFAINSEYFDKIY